MTPTESSPTRAESRTRSPRSAADRSARLAGLGNQFRRETAWWRHTSRGWRQALIWTAVLNGVLFLMLFVVPTLEEVAAQTGSSTVAELAAQYAGMAAVVTGAGVVFLTQGMVLDDQRSGTMEWLLSKPLSRDGLLLAKLGGQASGLLLAAVVVPWVASYVLLSIAEGALWSLPATLGAAALIGLFAVFNLSLVLLLSVLVGNRVTVLAIPLAALVGGDLFMTFVPETADVMPWALGSVAGGLLGGGVAPPALPVVATVGWTLLAVVVALWRFRRAEL